MLLAISRGSLMGAGDGWFGPGSGRYSWTWLAESLGRSANESIPRDQFPGGDLWFSRLDRNKDGQIRPDDLDWSESNPWVQQAYLVHRMFRRIDSSGDGRLTRDEWQAFFDKASNGKDHLLIEDLRDAVLGGASGGFLPGDAPSQEVLIRGLFAGELGSLNEGPRVGDQAPDFALKTHDGSATIRLGEVIGKKPIVLTFGNFTCGPFRSMFPGVEEVHKRFADEAVFLAVYVREAHPVDGWKMESNARVGVAVSQPKTYDERTAVANQCHQLLKPTMPLLVDEINDPVGNAYSGMPARLYVIDKNGKVAYKGGRGPFGFKAGEMEQALVMTLLDDSLPHSQETAADGQTGRRNAGQ
jgi:thiol-disulfide isomerase/thioredoxin